MKKIIAGVGFFGVFAASMLSASAAYFNSTPIARCETQVTRTLQNGSENNDVYVLQQFLVNAGYLHANPNGYYGNQTRTAVVAFQRDNQLPQTGSVGPLTRDALNERLCDTDLLDNQVGFSDDFGYASNITYVGANDPFVRVVTPPASTPNVYATPQGSVSVAVTTTSAITSSPLTVQVPLQVGVNTNNYNNSYNYPFQVQPSGQMDITSPRTNTIYREGETVVVAFTTQNMHSASFAILLENTATGQSKTVGVSAGPSFSFILTKELLDAVCAGPCTEGQFGSFRIALTSPTTDPYGNLGSFRTTISPLTIKRPLTATGKVTLTSSKTSVASGEAFKLYVNFPSTSWDATLAANYTIKVRAVCTSTIAATVGGLVCGQEYALPQNSNPTTYQQEVAARIVNPLFTSQEVTFQVRVVNILDQTVGFSEAKVTVASAPLGW